MAWLGVRRDEGDVSRMMKVAVTRSERGDVPALGCDFSLSHLEIRANDQDLE